MQQSARVANSKCRAAVEGGATVGTIAVEFERDFIEQIGRRESKLRNRKELFRPSSEKISSQCLRIARYARKRLGMVFRLLR